MNTDICKCKRERGQHDGLGLDACLSFKLDRKATWDADKLRAHMGKIQSRVRRALGLAE